MDGRGCLCYARCTAGVWRSPEAHLHGVQGAVGSNPITPTISTLSPEKRMTTSGSGKPAWVLEHLERYIATDGEDGHMWRGTPTLLLTTTGRKSGRGITTPLIYGTHEGNCIVVASRGGAPDHPHWYYNLSANPSVRVQVAADKFNATARTANPEEKSALWQLMAGIYPPYDEYQAKTERVIPVVILERAA